MDGHGIQGTRIVLSAANLLHGVVIVDFMVDAVEVDDAHFEVLACEGVRVDAVLAVGDGLVALEERGLLSSEAQHGVVGVVG